jgi:hypothetical protein
MTSSICMQDLKDGQVYMSYTYYERVTLLDGTLHIGYRYT